jgi:hypothetical protein
MADRAAWVEKITRRRAILIAAGISAAAVVPLPAWAQKAAGGGKGKGSAAKSAPAVQRPSSKPHSARQFFTPEEFAILDEMAELIIPADEHSGGARAAEVAAYIDARVREAIDAEYRIGWREDIHWMRDLAQQIYGRPLLKLTPEQKHAYLTRISRNEKSPKLNEEHTFATIKWEVALTYYSSKIGLLDELKYQGNVFIEEFVGVDVGEPAYQIRKR